MSEAPIQLQIPLDQIGELPPELYVGLIDQAAVDCLKARLGVEPLRTPIWVRQNGNKHKSRYSVIAGRHRLRAAKALGLEAIAAEVRADPSTSEEEIRRLQLAENLDRRVLRPIERALAIMHRWQEVAKHVELPANASQQTEAIRERWAVWETVSQAPAGALRLVDEAAAKVCGMTDRSVRTYRSIFQNLVVPFPDQFAQINAHALGKSLRDLARLAAETNEANRLKAVTLLLEDDREWKSMDEVFVEAGLKASNGNRADESRLDAVFRDRWGHMSRQRQRANFLYLAQLVPPEWLIEAQTANSGRAAK